MKKCACCKKPTRNNRKFCTQHLEKMKLAMRAFRAKRKELGLCARCSNPARRLPNGKPSTLCEECRAHVRQLETLQRLTKGLNRD